MRSWNFVRKATGVICLGALLTQQAIAQSETSDDEWNHSLAVYLWASSIGGTTASGSGVDVEFKDLLDHLEFAAMAAYQGRKGKWSVMTDVIYTDLEGNKQLDLSPPIGGGIISGTADASLGLKTWIIHLAGGYNLYDDREGTTTDFVLGARYLDLGAKAQLEFQIGEPGLGPSYSLEAGDKFWDAIVGLRGTIQIGDRWFIPWGANIGAGDSDLTWQAMAGVAFKASSWADIALTYRYLKWEFDDELIADLSFAGPMLGVVFRF